MSSFGRSRAASSRGLKDEIPDLEERVDHILTKQVFGIGITRLTSLLARRSVYCSKYAASEHSVATSFRKTNEPDGNIWFERMEHTWVGGTEWVLTADENGNQVEKFINGDASTAAPARRRSTGARTSKPTPMPSSTPTTSRLGSPSCSETTCSST